MSIKQVDERHTVHIVPSEHTDNNACVSVL